MSNAAKTRTASPTLDTTVEALMAKLGFEVTYGRNSDREDFRQCHVECVRDAIVAAFNAGKAAK
jgi:hypothetical protein